MTKQSANPRRYSKGSAALDPTQPLSVYLALHVGQRDMPSTVARIDYLAEQHPQAIVQLAGIRRESSDIILTLEFAMGPARQALRGQSPSLHAGYDLLWDMVKTLYYAHPVLCGPPHPQERASVQRMWEREDAKPASGYLEAKAAI